MYYIENKCDFSDFASKTLFLVSQTLVAKSSRDVNLINYMSFNKVIRLKT